MKHKNKGVLGVVVTTVVSVVVALFVGAGGNAAADGPGRSDGHSNGRAENLILGTWVVEIPNPAGGMPNEAFATYTPDGGVIAIDSFNDSTTLGSWKYLGQRRFVASRVAYRHTAQRQLESRVVIRHESRINGDTASGTYDVDVYSPTGVRLGGGEGRFTARRYEVQPLD